VAFTFHAQEEKAQTLAEAVRATGRRALCGRVEALDEKSVEGFTGRVEAEWGRVDALVNNVGGTQVMPFALIDGADWDAAMGINLRTMFLFAKAVARGMIRRRAGALVAGPCPGPCPRVLAADAARPARGPAASASAGNDVSLRGMVPAPLPTQAPSPSSPPTTTWDASSR